MSGLFLPINILKFWYLEAPISLLSFFLSLNKAFLGLFSLPLMIQTFFRPWKNEYRKGLVGFSIFMGMIIKTAFIAGDLVLLCCLLIIEALLFFVFLLSPVLAFYLPFVKF
jgi:hypothetical protein